LIVVLLLFFGMSQRRREGVGAPAIPTGGVSRLYYWETSDVWGTLSRITEADLRRLRDQGAIFGGGDVERQYELVVSGVNERV
ncbi:hypothetical protein HN873_024168, partial [Arachis hypogaea]